MSATDINAAVRTGAITASAVVEAHLAHMDVADAAVGAFQLRLDASARREARAIDALDEMERSRLPLAGVPVAVKDNIELAGAPMRVGSRATSDAPSASDHVIVQRLRAAGAVIVGKTRVPELCLWGTSDGSFGTARSPWDPQRTAGGSSGGSAAAVSAAMVPVAHGNDGLGSIRIPAACCGLVGMKPGRGIVPAEIGADSWFGMAENGALATTVGDAAAVLGVMSGDASLGRIDAAPAGLRIALALAPPAPGLPFDGSLAAHVTGVADALASAGHDIVETAPPMPALRATLAIIGTWGHGAARDVDAFLADDPSAAERLERRTLRHARWGRLADRLGLVDARARDAWRQQLVQYLTRYDLLLTPTLARIPLRAGGWSRRGWLANLVANLTYAPYCGAVNFAGLPAIAVPAGVHHSGMPASAHFVARPGAERLLLAVAAEVERLRPWRRHAPASAAAGSTPPPAVA